MTLGKNSNTNNKSSILQYWKAIELFSPQKLPKKAPQDIKYPVFEVKDGDLVPWDYNHPLQKRKKGSYFWRYIAYCGTYKIENIRQLMTEAFGTDRESFDERADGESAVFCISLAPDGRVLFDSFILSTCAWACGRLKNPTPKNPNWLDGFESTSQELLYHLQENLKVDDKDKDGQAILKKGYNVGEKLSLSPLFAEINYFISKLGINTLGVQPTIIVKAFLVSAKNIYTSDDTEFLNSFYVKDLGKVSKALSSNDFGSVLANYLSEDEEMNLNNRIDLRKPESTSISFSKLAPGNTPVGRWPSKDHHPLVYAQQLAINSIFLELSGKAGIFTVNGPPGTGKTTLLRDLIASVVVSRAIKLSQLTSPSTAFSGERRWQSGNYTRVISLWKEDFKGYEIVVASSNNGAVENVTLEIPSMSSIDPSWQDKIDYFPGIASNLIQEPAWALLAAKLGNKSNRGEFVNKFWYATEDSGKTDEGIITETENVSGFLTYLKNIQNPINWNQSIINFNSALEKEKNIRNLHIKTYNDIVEKQNTLKTLRELKNNLSSNQTKEKQLKETLLELQAKENTAKSLLDKAISIEQLHLKNRPSFLQILFSLGKAYFRWKDEKSNYQSERVKAQAFFNDCKAQRENQEKLHRNTSNVITSLLSKVTEVNNKLSNINSAIAKKADSLGKFFPDFALWKDDDARELSSPWLEGAWNKARAEVFLQALNLHKAFIENTSEIFRKNLQGLMDVLSGSVPTSVPIDGVLSAWTTLFFVVPVVSTTFASFDRLFSHLGKENLGWLLIDEAGQATAQASVGALWRSKRAIVVGDPLQLEPINNIPFTAQQALRKHFKVSEKWLPSRVSTQILADCVSSLGTYLVRDEKPIWVGCPLRVHRRCDKPMFSISNIIAYDNMMVFGTPTRSKLSLLDSCWIDVKGITADGHWLEEEGNATVLLLKELVTNKVNTNDIFLISPFRTVVRRFWDISRTFQGVNFGTIHTVQGKEADVVILVLGGNPTSPGAKQWAAQKPNLLNVAASRAKRRLYVVGNKKSWEKYTYFTDLAELLPTHQKT